MVLRSFYSPTVALSTAYRRIGGPDTELPTNAVGVTRNVGRIVIAQGLGFKK